MKSLSRLLVLLPALGMMTLTACGPTSSTTNPPSSEGTTSVPSDNTYKKVIMPAGAPAIAYYNRLNDENVSINTEPSNVMKALVNGKTYGSVIFDFSKGLEKIKESKNDYKLARIITGGNLYLVGIGEENNRAPKKGDYIVSFGQGLLPDKVFSKIYGKDIVDSTHYVSSVSEAAAVLKDGVHNSKPVDYVLIAQPALFSQMNNKDAATYGKLHVIDNLRVRWKELTNQDAIPQAGLFIREQDYVNHTSYFDQELADLDTRLNTAITNPAEVKAEMDKQIPDPKEQAKLLKFNSNIVMGVQKDNQNGFALVSSEEAKTIDINAFLKSIDVDVDYSDYILKTPNRFF